MSSPSREVHNHGPEDGPGIGCSERLIGECMIAALKRIEHEAREVSDFLTGSREVPEALVDYAKEMSDRIAALEAKVEDLRNMKRMADEMIRIQGNKNNKLCAEVERLQKGLKGIVNDPHCSYENVVSSDRAYSTGVVDGHRCAANKARRTLNPDADIG